MFSKAHFDQKLDDIQRQMETGQFEEALANVDEFLTDMDRVTTSPANRHLIEQIRAHLETIQDIVTKARASTTKH